MEGCPFCEIVAGEREQEVVYADETAVAFLCEPPAAWGHVLVVPRYPGDGMGRACVWGAPPWRPPEGGEPERRRAAETIRRGVAAAGRIPPAAAAAAAIVDDRGRILLIREGYGRSRYGFPGGAVERGESPLDAVVREVREETGLEARVEDVVGVYRLESGLVVTLFRCAISGEPALPEGGEIAELGWFAPDKVPEPRTNLLRLALPDVLAGARGAVRAWTAPSS